MLRPLLCLALGSFAMASGAVAQDLKVDPLPPQGVEIPLTMEGRHLATEVLIEGKAAVFNLDTYALYPACVDQAYAQSMGFEVVGSVRNGDGSGKTVHRDVVLIPELRWGPVVFRDVSALVDDYSWVPAPSGGHIEGLLGYTLFRDLLLEVDYPGQCVRLSKGSLDPKGPHVLSDPILRSRPDVRLEIGNLPLIVGIDTGASSGFMLPLNYLDQLTFAAPPKVVGKAKTVYSEASISEARLVAPIRLAGHELPNEVATISEVFGKPLIGGALLARYSVTFDQRHGRVRFAIPKQPAGPTDRSTPSSPAKAPARDRGKTDKHP